MLTVQPSNLSICAPPKLPEAGFVGLRDILLCCCGGTDFCLLFVYFFLHSFILQAIYIVLQDLKMKMLSGELNIRLEE